MTIAKTHKEIEQTLGLVPEWIKQMPDGAAEGFWTSARDFWLAETEIPNKYKELIGLALSGATRCRYCALFHTEAAKLFGATDAELAEASAMAGLTMMGSTFINAQQVDYDQFAAETQDIINYVRAHSGQKAEQAGAEARPH